VRGGSAAVRSVARLANEQTGGFELANVFEDDAAALAAHLHQLARGREGSVVLVAGETRNCHPGTKGRIVDVGVLQDPVGCLCEDDAAGIPRDRGFINVDGVIVAHVAGRDRSKRKELQTCNSSRPIASRMFREIPVCVRFCSRICHLIFSDVDPGSITFVGVRLFPMSSVREFIVVDPDLGPRRAYLTSVVADMANVTSKTEDGERLGG